MKNNLQAPAEVKHDIFEMTAQEKAAAGIKSLPSSLKEAIEALKVNPLARPSLGDHIFDRYIENKEQEWDEYRLAITDWELKKYLSNYIKLRLCSKGGAKPPCFFPPDRTSAPQFSSCAAFPSPLLNISISASD